MAIEHRRISRLGAWYTALDPVVSRESYVCRSILVCRPLRTTCVAGTGKTVMM